MVVALLVRRDQVTTSHDLLKREVRNLVRVVTRKLGKGNEKKCEGSDALLTVKRLTVLGFSTIVDQLMSASDMIVTKPGGLTVSEAIAKCLPMVLIDPIPGQEDRNMDFLTNHGMAMRTNKHLPVDVAVWQLLSSEKRLHLMRSAQEAFGKPNATDDLQELIESYQK